MLIYFAKVAYHRTQPFHTEPRPAPRLPQRFDNNEHLRLYYDRVKCFVQLNHDETKNGCRQLLKRYIHRDHRRLVKLVNRYFYKGVEGRKDERVRSFWKEYDRIVRSMKVEVVLNTPQDLRPHRVIAHFAQELEKEFKRGPDETFFYTRLPLLQQVLVQWPDMRHLDLILNVLGSHPVIMKHLKSSSWLERSFHVNYSVSDTINDLMIPQCSVLPDVNVLDFMRQLTQHLVETTLLIQKDLSSVSYEPVPVSKIFSPEVFHFYNDLSTFELGITHRGEQVQYPHKYTSLLQHFLPLSPSKPQKPTNFVSSEQCSWYYSTLKQYIQLTHSCSLFGFRDLLLSYLHTDQDTSLKILVNSYGAGHQLEVIQCRGCFHCQLDAFWEEWESVLYFQAKRYPSQQLFKVIDDSVQKFEMKLMELKSIGCPTQLVQKELQTMQVALNKYPSVNLLEKLVCVMDSQLPIRPLLCQLQGVEVFGGGLILTKGVCVLEFMKELTQSVVIWTISTQEDVKIDRPFSPQRRRMATPSSPRSKRVNNTGTELHADKRQKQTCDFCGDQKHCMENCSRFSDLLQKGLLRYNRQGELCMSSGCPITVSTRPFIKTPKLRSYLHQCGDQLVQLH